MILQDPTPSMLIERHSFGHIESPSLSIGLRTL